MRQIRGVLRVFESLKRLGRREDAIFGSVKLSSWWKKFSFLAGIIELHQFFLGVPQPLFLIIPPILLPRWMSSWKIRAVSCWCTYSEKHNDVTVVFMPWCAKLLSQTYSNGWRAITFATFASMLRFLTQADSKHVVFWLVATGVARHRAK